SRTPFVTAQVLGIISAVCCSTLLFAQPSGVSVGGKFADLPRLPGNVSIDGSLNEADWARAALIVDLHQVFPQENAAPTEATEVRVFYTDNALYIGARMLESDPSRITGRVLRQGQSLD